ncbi:glycosyltransferase family 4 protein [Clostridium butyricum]|jgi:glycosyltransferase involved in cell wall biosynthesis|uniref:Glycosyltransferase WbuB n=1 Tax=Clostridium butyricum TaxID=1492 RepID=A0A512TJV4_CLOBU|nr:glycosyltransferase family 4 protein [Clostridium butyricum]ETI90765.1 MAG: WblI protein [Clostridium butyricum DORA_1]MBS5983470.1 glycosyltransferase family 4 protein [Clostridium butyricum]MBZ0313207.1 glycosyltransferase family 4 protein [Clostridium butyricum]MDB2151611.1 glycosyltransferase family 4 protein [Clostridium butyricum]MDB2159147.1 glycosyltransferase family 4 protein [Clostridium butyricum]
MNILLINHYAGSDYHGMEFRPFYMAREWKNKGHNVTILGANFSHLRKNNPVIEKDFQEEVIDGITYVWVKTPQYQGNGVGRIKNISTFMWKLRTNYKMLADKYKPDAVIASSTYPLDIYPAHRIAKRCNAKLCFEIHDLWPLSPMEIGGFSEKNPAIVILQRAEDFAFKNSDVIVSILPNADKHIRERGFSTDKFVYVPNGILTGEKNEAPMEKTIERLQELKEQGYFLVGYTGNHSPANVLDTMIDAAKKTTDEKVKYVLVGKGNVKNELMEYAKANNVTNIEFLDPVLKDNMDNVLELLDIGYIGLKKQNLFNYGVSPNKLFDYMMASLPVIYAVEASNDPVKDSNCGISVPAENPEAVVEAVMKIKNLSEEEKIKMGGNGKKYVLDNHMYEGLADKFLNALKK